MSFHFLTSSLKYRSCLKVNSKERISIFEITKQFEDNFVDLNSPCMQTKQTTPTHSSQSPISSASFVQPLQLPGSAQSSLGFSGFTRYLKDTSSKVMQTVQQ